MAGATEAIGRTRIHERPRDEPDTATPRSRPEPLARQHHPRARRKRDAQALHRRILGDRTHVESHDLPSGDQGQLRVRRLDPRQARRGQVGRSPFPRPGAGGPAAGGRPLQARFTSGRRASTAGFRSKSRRSLRTTRRPRSPQARELHARAGRRNLFIKIPGTKEGRAGDRRGDLLRRSDQRDAALFAPSSISRPRMRTCAASSGASRRDSPPTFRRWRRSS